MVWHRIRSSESDHDNILRGQCQYNTTVHCTLQLSGNARGNRYRYRYRYEYSTGTPLPIVKPDCLNQRLLLELGLIGEKTGSHQYYPSITSLEHWQSGTCHSRSPGKGVCLHHSKFSNKPNNNSQLHAAAVLPIASDAKGVSHREMCENKKQK